MRENPIFSRVLKKSALEKTVEIKANDISVYGRGYIYQENETFYFEIPYVGVYKLLDLV